MGGVNRTLNALTENYGTLALKLGEGDQTLKHLNSELRLRGFLRLETVNPPKEDLKEFEHARVINLRISLGISEQPIIGLCQTDSQQQHL